MYYKYSKILLQLYLVRLLLEFYSYLEFYLGIIR